MNFQAYQPLHSFHKSREVSALNDKVYGLLRLIKKSYQEHLLMDIKRPTNELFMESNLLLFVRYQSDQFLSFVGLSKRNLRAMPS